MCRHCRRCVNKVSGGFEVFFGDLGKTTEESEAHYKRVMLTVSEGKQ